jgi:cation-transporting ATPase E
MQKYVATYKIILKHLKQVVIANSVTLVNGIFLAVSILLAIFGETHEAWFLLIVLVLNVVIGIIQDLRAKVALEQLQILMAPKILRLGKNGEEIIGLNDVRAGDKLKISLGDQIAADGEVESHHGLEVNEALLTGESVNIHKQQQAKVLAGSIVTAGSGIMVVHKIPRDSFVSKMTDKIKQYTVNLSPIQQTLKNFIKYMSYVLLAVVIYVIFHGLRVHELLVLMVKDIASLTSTLVPQGLILATTIFFAYGAIKMFKKQVLLQEINATEKLGRIKNLCVDKTGTLTENKPVMEKIEAYQGGRHYDKSLIEQLIGGYIKANEDKSETMNAILGSLAHPFAGAVAASVPFSSTRKYGAASLRLDGEIYHAVVGAPELLLNLAVDPQEKHWLEPLINLHARQAKRLVLLAVSDNKITDQLGDNLVLHPVALFVLQNPLRPGTKDVINFFQNRKVSIRVISGDNPQTVQAIGLEAGIKGSDMIITGPEMEKWDDEAFAERVPAYHLFARISPQQKEKIIEQLKTVGYTAMVGDGANDALAIKKSDLGIAMFDGASATRQIAQIVLMNNSFAALPAGVDLAETIITNIEFMAGIFFNQAAVGLLLFLILAVFGYTYPLSPRNATIMNYFVIWLPLAYWTIWPARLASRHVDKSFLRRVVPFSLLMAVTTAVAAVIVFMIGPNALKFSDSNILVVITLVILGYWFFVLTPIAYGLKTSLNQKRLLWVLAGVGVAFLTWVMFNDDLSPFFDLHKPALLPLLLTLSITFFFGLVQMWITKKYFYKKSLEKPV